MAPLVNNWTLPNVLTVARILLTPLFVAFFLEQHYLSALFMFFLAGLSDALDGFLARVLNQRSQLGEMLDPLADKVLLVSAYVCLAVGGWLPVWLAVLVVSRDGVILGGMALLTFWGQDMRGRTAPSLVGKLTTMAQMLLVLGIFLHELAAWAEPWRAPLDVLLWLTAGLTTLSGIQYVVKGVALFSSEEKP